jgi:hypothetical protein
VDIVFILLIFCVAPGNVFDVADSKGRFADVLLSSLAARLFGIESNTMGLDVERSGFHRRMKA